MQNISKPKNRIDKIILFENSWNDFKCYTNWIIDARELAAAAAKQK